MAIHVPVPEHQREERFASLSRSGWLSLQSEDFRLTVMRVGRVIRLRPQEQLSLEGDDDSRIFGVIQGAVGTYSSHRREVPILGSVVVAGHWFGFGPRLAGGGGRTLSFISKDETELLCIGEPEFQQIGSAFPDLNGRLGHLAQLSSIYSNQIVAELLIPRTDRRIVAVMLRLCEYSRAELSFPVSQAELAEMANASRSSVSKTLKYLEQSGLLDARYGRIVVTDYPGLKRWFETTAELGRD